MSATAAIRTARKSDLEAILNLERSVANAPHWPEEAYRSILKDAPVQDAPQLRCLWVAEIDGSVAGFAVGVLQPAADSTAELESVAVRPSLQRQGIGGSLCDAVLGWCRRLGASRVILEVRAGSEGAIRMYAGLGFAPIGRRPNYYRDPDEDALLMELRFD